MLATITSMRITEIDIGNVGAISNLSISIDPSEGLKPILLVGSNGTGKSLALSIIADSMIELAKKNYSNITTTVGLSTSFFRVTGALNNRIGSDFNYSFVKYSDPDLGDAIYSDRSGELPPERAEEWALLMSKYGGMIGAPGKLTQGALSEEAAVEKVFNNNAICYFPPSRHEKPFWINETEYKDNKFYGINRYTKILKYDLILETTWELNRLWIMNVYTDSLSDVQADITGRIHLALVEPIRYQELIKNRQNVESIISAIFEETNLKLYATLRNTMEARRLALIKNGALFLPSLDSLSTGQMILLNMFTSILRIAESDDLSKSRNLDEIHGIVVIDEIDAHLHSDLQYTVLPNIISLFPKVQFFISTHSPLFVLGLEKKLGTECIRIIDMNSGAEINSERFSEFQKSYDYYKASVTFDNDMQQRLKQLARPTIFLEGESDVIYLKRALEVLERNDILEIYDINKVGATIDGKEVGGGDSGLDRLREFVKTNEDYLTRPTLLIYDCDIRKSPENIELLSIRSTPKIDDIVNDKGVENLLPETYFTATDEEFSQLYSCERSEFWARTELKKGYGTRGYSEEFKKVRFANWFCDTQASITNFANFQRIIEIIDEFTSLQNLSA